MARTAEVIWRLRPVDRGKYGEGGGGPRERGMRLSECAMASGAGELTLDPTVNAKWVIYLPREKQLKFYTVSQRVGDDRSENVAGSSELHSFARVRRLVFGVGSLGIKSRPFLPCDISPSRLVRLGSRPSQAPSGSTAGPPTAHGSTSSTTPP
ncbi:hypothetical protein B296_00012148 [Ensete ventricosum]|uniref:Uncharacterized protein n=1 Tax=Ensete ventricosum TaxID=4639 RepID=A0A427A6V6_ENSVE|nr:hypothetical protein B296_00012148 [Ensete ventricosum]